MIEPSEMWPKQSFFLSGHVYFSMCSIFVVGSTPYLVTVGNEGLYLYVLHICLPTKHEIFVWVTVTFLTCSTC